MTPSRKAYVEYLGHKAALLPRVIAAIIGGEQRSLRVLDAFSGTSAVGRELRRLGHRVHANDHLALCETWACSALLVPSNPLFRGVLRYGSESDAPYHALLRILVDVRPKSGFMTEHYSPASLTHDGVERRYLTVDNAMRIDGIRAQIAAWDEALTRGERGLLLGTLVSAVMAISNTAGTYGCYLKSWKPKALQTLQLRALALPADDLTQHEVTIRDAVDVAAEVDADVLYADPPYTKRQYAAYYHLLETLIRSDEPTITGSTGLRDWQTHASDWCYRRKAPQALDALIAKSSTRRFVLSYSEDGQIPHELILEILAAYGRVSSQEVVQRRYRSSQLPHKGTQVTERIYTLVRS